MKKNLKLILAATVAATFAASAHDTPNALVDSQGKAVKGDFGQCIESVYNEVNAECGVMEVKITLDAKTLFDTAKFNLRPDALASLNKLTSNIKQGMNLGKIKTVTDVTVVGHTDSRGSVAYNQKLSENRALSVAQYLASQGVSPKIIKAFGAGELKPVATNKTAAGRQMNRRVEIAIQGVGVKK